MHARALGWDLEPGQYCQQYVVLGLMPIDVIYDKQDHMIHIFDSYE